MSPTTAGPTNGVYSSRLTRGELTELIGLLPAGTHVFELRTRIGTDWVSQSATRVTMNVPTFATSPTTCQVTDGS